MADAEARAILNSYGAPANIAQHIEAINTAIRALGGKAPMAEIWAWAESVAEMMEEKWKNDIPRPQRESILQTVRCRNRH